VKILRLLFVFGLFALGQAAEAQTKLFLRNAISGLGRPLVNSYTGYGCNGTTADRERFLANTTAGSAAASFTFAPTSTAPPCHIFNTSFTYPLFFSPPLSAGVTISGNIDFNITCSESATATNAGMRMIVYRWSVKVGGVVSTIITSANTAECNGTRLAIAAAAPTSTVMDAGDRLVFLVEVTNVGGAWGGNSTRTVTMQADAASGSTGDTFANFANTLSFAADINNGRALVSRVFELDEPSRKAMQRRSSTRAAWTSQPPRTCPWKFLTGCSRSNSLTCASISRETGATLLRPPLGGRSSL